MDGGELHLPRNLPKYMLEEESKTKALGRTFSQLSVHKKHGDALMNFADKIHKMALLPLPAK